MKLSVETADSVRDVKPLARTAERYKGLLSGLDERWWDVACCVWTICCSR